MVSVAKKAISGAAWSISTSMGSRAVSLIGTLVLARFLVPEEYGEVSAASIMVTTANAFSTLGVGTYVIANPKAPRSETFHATAGHVLIGFFVLLGAVALRNPLGPVFDSPNMGKFVPGLALAMMMDRIAFIPERTLLRDLRFRIVAIMRSLAEVLFTAVSLGLVICGFGAMCIVWGNLARSGFRLLITLTAASRRDWLEPHPFHWATMKKLATYGFTQTLGGLAYFASRRWDNILVSRYFGPAMMGTYNYAYNLADVPATQVGEQITDVLQASFPHLEPEKRAGALIRSTTLLGLIIFPLAVGLGATAPTVVHAFFNRKWLDIAPMLMLLSVLSVPRPISGGLHAYLMARNHVRTVAILDWLQLAMVMGFIMSFGRLGPRWTCLAVGLAFMLRLLGDMWAVQKHGGAPMGKLLRSILPPLAACVPLLGAVVGVRYGMQYLGVRPVISLVAEVTVGVLVYIGSALVIARDASRDLLGVVRSALERRRPAANPPTEAPPTA